MDIKTITATLALLGSGIPLAACDSAEKPATEVDAKSEKSEKSEKSDEKADEKADVKADAESKGEMACGEGKCGAGGCGAKKGDKGEASCGGEKEDKAFADGEKQDPAAEAAAKAAEEDKDAEKS